MSARVVPRTVRTANNPTGNQQALYACDQLKRSGGEARTHDPLINRNGRTGRTVCLVVLGLGKTVMLAVYA